MMHRNSLNLPEKHYFEKKIGSSDFRIHDHNHDYESFDPKAVSSTTTTQNRRMYSLNQSTTSIQMK